MTDIVARLEASLDLPDLPDAARKNARALFESLSRPVIVAVLGPPGSGKSALINLFLRDCLLPAGLSANVVEIVPAEAFAAEVSYPDGRLEATERDELGDVQNADRVHIAAPNAVLRDMVLIEASGCGSQASLKNAIAYASERADIVLWCTQSFTEDEKELWKQIDQQKKDHAFLLLTKADKMARKRKLAQALAALTGVAQEEFSGLLPIATLQALKALDTDPVDDDLWAGSGADGLLKRISDHVRYGRQADFDQAELFLARYTVGGGEGSDAPVGRRTSQPHTNAPRRRRSRMTREVVAAMRNEAAEAAEIAHSDPVAMTHPPSTEHVPDEQPVTRPLELDLVIERPVSEPLAANTKRKAAKTVPLNEPPLDDLDVEPARKAPEDQIGDLPVDPHDPAPDDGHMVPAGDAIPGETTDAPVAEDEPAAKTSEDPDLVLVVEPEPAPDTGSLGPAEAPAPRVTSDSLADRLGAMRRVVSKQLLTPDSAAKTGLDEIAKTATALARLQDEPEKVLHLCTDTADTLQEVFDNGALPANLIELRDEVLQTCEHMTLLQLENTAGSAADAVTLLLQLKRDFEARQAA
ncbi:MAG: hypothetical protein AAFX45_09620 [Pseudomonadota bacterium]